MKLDYTTLKLLNKKLQKINKNGGAVTTSRNDLTKLNTINRNIKNLNQKNNSNLPLIQVNNGNVGNKENAGNRGNAVNRGNAGKKNRQMNLNSAVGILDPNAKNINPMTGKEYQNPDQYLKLAKIWSGLPVYQQRLEFIKAIAENQVILVAAGTGSGKTVLVPKYALHTYGYQARIAVTNPKRIPSEGAAEFAAKAMDVNLGEEVGYQHKFARIIDKGGQKSKLIFLTDGLINAKISGNDPLLSEYDMIIIDEAHERNVQIDFLLMNLRRALLKRRDLKLIIMSATIDEKKFIDYFPSNLFKFKFLSAEGKPFKEIKEYFLPVAINKFDNNGNLTNKDYIPKAVEQLVKIIASGEPGNILVFLTSNKDGIEACRLLKEELTKRKIEHRPFCIELHAKSKEENKLYAVGELPYAERSNGPWDRKIIMATDVAESAITFKDVIKFVIDSGLSNQDFYYTDKGLSALEKKYISQASHQQRRGRTGRQEDGTCYNLFSEKEYKELFSEYTIAPIMKSNLTDPIFKLFNSPYLSYADFPFRYQKKYKGWKNFTQEDVDRIIRGEKDSLDIILQELIDPPDENYVNNSLKNLLIMNALTGTDIKNGSGKLIQSEIGKQMTVFRSTPPEISRMILAGYEYHVRDDILIIAAMLENSDGQMDSYFLVPNARYYKDKKQFERDNKKYSDLRKKLGTASGDHMCFYNLYHLFERKKETLFAKYTNRNNKVNLVFKELRAWCQDNFINYKKLDNINKDYIKDYRRQLDQIVNTRTRVGSDVNSDVETGVNSGVVETGVDSGVEQTAGTNASDDNIQRAILAGFKHNFCVGQQKNILICYPPVQSLTNIDKQSALNLYSSAGKYYVYFDYISIFGQSNINIVSKIKASVAGELSKAVLPKCFSKSPEKLVQNFKNVQQRDGKQKDGKQKDGKQKDGKQRDGKQKDGKQRDGKQKDGKQKNKPRDFTKKSGDRLSKKQQRKKDKQKRKKARRQEQRKK